MSASVGLPLLLCCFTSDPLTSQEEFVTLVTALSRIPTDRASPLATGRPSMSTITPGTAFLPSPTGPTVLTGTPGAVAVTEAAQQFVDLFTSLGGLMAERVTDVRDVRDRIVAELTGQGEPGVPAPAVPSVLLADDLAPADAAGLDPTRVIGLATRLGGTTSHTAIIARQLGLPCVVAVTALDDVPEGVIVLLDGEQGTVTVGPDPEQAQRRVAASRAAAEL